jgi:hypothetical protein
MTPEEQIREFRLLRFDMDMFGVQVYQRLPDGGIERIDPNTLVWDCESKEFRPRVTLDEDSIIPHAKPDPPISIELVAHNNVARPRWIRPEYF